MRKTPALRALTTVLSTPPPVAKWSTRHATCITPRWTHGPVHAYVPPMSGHLIAVVFEADCVMQWRQGSCVRQGIAMPGSVTIVPEGEDGYWDIPRPIDGMQLVISGGHLDALARAVAPDRSLRLTPEVAVNDPTLFRLMRMLERQLADADTAHPLLVEQSLELFCLQLVASHAGLTVPLRARPVKRTALSDATIRRVDEFLAVHVSDAVTIEDLARVAGLSSHYFCTVYRQATGTTPHSRLTSLRMQHAKELLVRHSSLSVGAIASAVGYQTTSAFCQAFKRAIGTTPGLYRRTR